MKKLYGLLLFLFIGCAFAQYAIDRAPSSKEPLTVDQAFQFSAASRDYQTIIARWHIKPGYFLYRARFHFRAIKPEGARLSQPLLPVGIQKTTPGVGSYEIYKDVLNIPIPVIAPQGKRLILEANYQGCSQSGYCYPPTMKVVPIDLSKNYLQFKAGIAVDIATPTQSATEKPIGRTNHVEELLRGGNVWTLIIGFLGFGLLLAFTPCVLPMIPVLSAIITGQKKMSVTHAFCLSLAYVLGMSITYAIAGVLVGLVGGSIQAALQIPWIIILFSLLFIAMALSLFGIYEIQLPKRWRSKLAQASEHQKRGTYFGAFIMGILSTLILSPCITPPLVGVLSYIGNTGHALLGGLALFTMGVGMGLPLLLIGFSHGKLLPKVGVWMNDIKNTMGILMLAMTIWILQRIIEGAPIMLMWAALAIGTSIYMGALTTAKTKWGIIRKGLGIIVFVYGILLIVGTATNHYNPLLPLQFAKQCLKRTHELPFKTVKTVADVKKEVVLATKNGKPVMLDFWAQWCISCKEMDNFTFTNPKVQKILKNFVLLRADVTSNNAQDKALQRHFNVIAPPTILFFTAGKEQKHRRIIGEMSAEAFLKHVRKIGPEKN